MNMKVLLKKFVNIVRKHYIIIMFFLLFFCTSTKAYALSFEIEDVSISDKSSTVSTDTISYTSNEISSNVTFNSIDDYVVYDIKIKNNEDKLFKIESISDNTTNDNLVIGYEKESEIKAKSSSTIRLIMTYKNKLVNKNITLDNLEITINFVDEGGEDSTIIINPVTGDNIVSYLVLLIISLVGIGFIITNKRLKHLKIGIIILAICVISIPFVTFAIEDYKFSFKFSDVVINGEFEEYDITLVDQGSSTSFKRTYGEVLGTLPSAFKVGHTFDGWYSNNVLVNDNTVVKGPMTIESRFIPNKHTLTINDSEYVETDTPSGEYDYGTEITLKAKNRLGYTFVKWSNDNTDTEITFTITSDIEIGPIYSQDVYTIIFDSKGGSDVSNKTGTYNQALGTLENPTKHKYNFDGWYTLEDGGEKITSDTKITGNTTYYAHWDPIGFNTVFSHEGACTFNAYDNITGDECSEYWDTNYINTGIALFSEENNGKDFEAGFTIVSYNSGDQTSEKNQVFMSDKKETGGTAIVPGIVARRSSQPSTAIDISFGKNGNKTGVDLTTTINTIKMFRIDGNIYYSINDGEKVLLNSNISDSDVFNVPLTFGAGYTVDGSILRPVKATLSNMYVKLGYVDLDDYYKITYDGTDGSLVTNSKSILKGDKIGNFPTGTKNKSYIAGWSLENGSTDYINSNYVPDSDITLYATWKKSIEVLNVSNTSISLNVGETESIVITNPTEVEEEYYFTSSDNSKASVDTNGVITAKASGSVNIYLRGRASGKSKTIRVTVN